MLYSHYKYLMINVIAAISEAFLSLYITIRNKDFNVALSSTRYEENI